MISLLIEIVSIAFIIITLSIKDDEKKKESDRNSLILIIILRYIYFITNNFWSNYAKITYSSKEIHALVTK